MNNIPGNILHSKCDILSTFLPFSGIIVYIQNIYYEIPNFNEIFVLGTMIANLLMVSLLSIITYNRCMKCAKMKGDLGNY